MNKEQPKPPQTKEIEYYKSQVNSLTGTIISLQYRLAEMTNEIAQMKKGFGLIADLQGYNPMPQTGELYDHFAEQIILQMQMDHCVVLQQYAGDTSYFFPMHCKGYSVNEAAELEAEKIIIPARFRTERKSLLHNSQTEPTPFSELLCAKLKTKYFILTPITLNSITTAFLFTGRKVEVVPLASSRLLTHDVHALEAIAGVIAAIKSQLDQLKLVEMERTRIAREMHDEIGSELTKIKMYSQLLLREGTTEAQKDRLQKISNTTTKVLENVGEIIWTMNSWNDNLENLAAFIRRYAAEYLEAHEIDYRFNFPDELPEVFIGGNYRRNIFLVVKEALHNIVKHAGATAVLFSLCFERQAISFTITDNGKGLNGKHTAGTGLLSMKHRMEALHGYLKVSAAEGGGVTLCLSVPLAAD